jgi:hypothetical protein
MSFTESLLLFIYAIQHFYEFIGKVTSAGD